MSGSSPQRNLQMTSALRAVEGRDNVAVAAIIRAVLTEFGCTAEGFAIHDPEVDSICETYSAKGSAYFVIEHEGKVVGGAGVAPLKGGDADTCELQKNYLLPEYRGHGYGALLFARCLEATRLLGYKRCYLETLEHMTTARAMYERAGFKKRDTPMGATGHFGCNCWYIKEL